jgi:hypothetical protein
MSYVSAALRRLVTERARERCEYCLFPQTASLFAFEMEHISEKIPQTQELSKSKRYEMVAWLDH